MRPASGSVAAVLLARSIVDSIEFRAFVGDGRGKNGLVLNSTLEVGLAKARQGQQRSSSTRRGCSISCLIIPAIGSNACSEQPIAYILQFAWNWRSCAHVPSYARQWAYLSTWI
ncbi:hypothetical protein OE88DRAFT_1388601 [Heliocybe sulcata]|uniref:Uncharacterized protein n=1 Tax=Heliocybe sulcata TaxID=5364 RepID=A0A5C3N3L5_9AGAM|nr:hypothetical protein OE88DRAFT_1388601 [Heliocybe sulcata]